MYKRIFNKGEARKKFLTKNPEFVVHITRKKNAGYMRNTRARQKVSQEEALKEHQKMYFITAMAKAKPEDGPTLLSILKNREQNAQRLGLKLNDYLGNTGL